MAYIDRIAISFGDLQIDTISTWQGPQGIGVPAGGTTTQLLSKASNTDYDYVWTDQGAASVTAAAVTLAITAMNATQTSTSRTELGIYPSYNTTSATITEAGGSFYKAGAGTMTCTMPAIQNGIPVTVTCLFGPAATGTFAIAGTDPGSYPSISAVANRLVVITMFALNGTWIPKIEYFINFTP